MKFLLSCVLFALLHSHNEAFRRHLPVPVALRSNGFSDSSSSSSKYQPTHHTPQQQSPTQLNAIFDGIAEKLGGIVSVLQGQTTITEASIESTLRKIKNILIDAATCRLPNPSSRISTQCGKHIMWKCGKHIMWKCGKEAMLGLEMRKSSENQRKVATRKAMWKDSNAEIKAKIYAMSQCNAEGIEKSTALQCDRKRQNKLNRE
jgi:hypothetical protein